MDRIQFLEHKGKKILYVDLSNVKYEEGKNLFKEAQKIIFASAPYSLLIIHNFTDAEVTPQATYDLKQYVTQNKPYIKASAVIGIGGIKRIILNAVSKFSGRKFYVFDTLEEAKEFLVTVD